MVAFTKSLEFLKIAGSGAEFLHFEFWIYNFFWKHAIIFIQGQNSMEFICGCKNLFYEDCKKSVGQCWFGMRPIMYGILSHKYPWMTSDQKVLWNWPDLKFESNGGLCSSKNFGLQCKISIFLIANLYGLWGPLDNIR